MNRSDDESINLLRSIDATLKELLALSKTKRAATSAPAMPAPRQPLETAATEADLDSQYGDEATKFKPRNWTGDWTKGQRMSECEPAFLDMLAEAHDYFAEKNKTAGDMQKAGYELRSARRARGWAQRLRNGWKPKAVDGIVSGEDIRW